MGGARAGQSHRGSLGFSRGRRSCFFLITLLLPALRRPSARWPPEAPPCLLPALHRTTRLNIGGARGPQHWEEDGCERFSSVGVSGGLCFFDAAVSTRADLIHFFEGPLGAVCACGTSRNVM